MKLSPASLRRTTCSECTELYVSNGTVSSTGERPSRRRGTPGSYSVSPGYIGNYTADWAQLSSSSRLGPTDCASPGDPDPTSGCPCCSLVGYDDEQWSYELLSCRSVREIGGEGDNAPLTDWQSDLASLP